MFRTGFQLRLGVQIGQCLLFSGQTSSVAGGSPALFSDAQPQSLQNSESSEVPGDLVHKATPKIPSRQMSTDLPSPVAGNETKVRAAGLLAFPGH